MKQTHRHPPSIPRTSRTNTKSELLCIMSYNRDKNRMFSWAVLRRSRLCKVVLDGAGFASGINYHAQGGGWNKIAVILLALYVLCIIMEICSSFSLKGET